MLSRMGVIAVGALAVILAAAPSYADEYVIPDDYDTLERALADLKARGRTGDTLLLRRGSYTVNATLDFPVTIRGEETIATVLEGEDATGTVFSVSAAQNVIVKNLTFRNADEGIRVASSLSVSVVNNVFRLGTDSTAVIVEDSSSVNIANNTFYGNQVGVNRASSDTAIKNNAFVGHESAISSVGIFGGVSFNGYYSNDDNGLEGTDAVTGLDPLFVSVSLSDFHLKQASPLIDAGDGTDVVDDTTADIGAYGGPDSDVLPAKVRDIAASDATVEAGTASIDVSWSPNLSYIVTHSSAPGSYRVYYDSDGSGDPYEGVDAGGGTLTSPINVGNVAQYRLENLSVPQHLPAAPAISQIDPADGTMTLRWSAVPNATGYYLYYGVADVSENKVSAGAATEWTVTGLTNGQPYMFAVSAWFQARYYVNVTAVDSTGEDDRMSQYGTEASVTMGNVIEGAQSSVLTAIPEVPRPFPELPDEGCFVATAAFGGIDAPAVRLLRSFRDRYLRSTVAGRLFIRGYYKYSPALADTIRGNVSLRWVAQIALAPLVAVAAAMTSYPTLFCIILLLWGVGRFALRSERQW